MADITSIDWRACFAATASLAIIAFAADATVIIRRQRHARIVELAHPAPRRYIGRMVASITT